ncbi:hypothetical protein M1446_04930 [Candidatus Dependentiae bacterium]|nr:hypothetical protein [Candidatus Dependentiae bacterium]
MNKLKSLLFLTCSFFIFDTFCHDKVEELIREYNFSGLVDIVRPGTISSKDIIKYQKLVNQLLKDKIVKKDNSFSEKLNDKKFIVPVIKIAAAGTISVINLKFLNDVWKYYKEDQTSVVEPDDNTYRVVYFAAGYGLITCAYLAGKSIYKNINKILNQKNKDIKNLFLIHLYLENLK